jgi:hypothetical protein
VEPGYADAVAGSANVRCAVLLPQVSESSSWWARSSSLEFLQVFVFHNMATVLSKQDWVHEVRSPVQGKISDVTFCYDRLCGLVVRVLGYRSGVPGSIPGTTKKKNIVGL